MKNQSIDLDWLTANSQYIAEARSRWPEDCRSLDPDGKAPALEDDWHSRPEQALRRYRQLHSVRIAWRDITGQDSFSDTSIQLTGLAEDVLEKALEVAETRIRERFGDLADGQGTPIRLCILALGKLGGGELNFNSDLDVMFCYSGQGQANGPRRLSAREYLSRVAGETGRILDQVTEHGRVWVVDTRLRPFGSAGALVWSVDAMEQYYLSEGRTWERYALLKMRPVAGDLECGRDLCQALEPFVFRRYLDYGIFESLRELHTGIRREARESGNENDLKVGPGGIRALEFVVQSIQLLRGGRHRELRTPGFTQALAACRDLELFSGEEAGALDEDYRFLRVAENRLQYVTGRQTQRIPREDRPREQLARMMGNSDWTELAGEIQSVRDRVEEQFQTRFEAGEESTAGQSNLWPLPEHERLSGQLESLGFGEADQAATYLKETEKRISRQPLSKEGRRRLDGLMPLLLDEIAAIDRPDGPLADLLRLVESIARRSAYIALLREHPPVLARLVRIFAASGRVAQWIIQSPQLLDDLLLPNHEHRLPAPPRLRDEDPEQNLFELARFRQTGFLRTGLGELEGVLSPDQARKQLAELARTILQAMLDHLRGDAPPPAVIGYGNLGAEELHYESDLDLVFLYDRERGSPQRKVQRLISLLEAPAPGGRLYEIDTRLRPNGRAGLLVSPFDAFVDYQENQAWTWEHQALIRARWVAGDRQTGEAFEAFRREILTRKRDGSETRKALKEMRARQQAERRENRFRAVLTDIQFIAELGILQQAAENPELAEYRSTRKALDGLGSLGWLTGEETSLLVEAWEAAGQARHENYLRRAQTGGTTEDDSRKIGEIHDRVFRER